jgi:hypothetical protein
MQREDSTYGPAADGLLLLLPALLLLGPPMAPTGGPVPAARRPAAPSAP